MAKRVEDFALKMMTDVFNAAETAPLAMKVIEDAGSFDPGPKAARIEDPADWTPEKIREKAKPLAKKEGPAGDFDD
jgi:hypothetical protein